MDTTALAVLCATLALAGCASMSRNECATVDWRTVGYEDGVAGRTGDAIGRHRKACADHGVTPDLDAYQAGRAEGLREYCHADNGFRVGASGARYGGPCPADLSPAFTAAYESGRELYVREYRVNHAHARLAAMRTALAQLEQQMASEGFIVASATSTPEERTHAFIEAKQLIERHERLEAEIASLEADTLRYEQELADYRTQFAYAR
jgi:hypothetical protein